jgi:hypothetical protein
MIGDLRPGVDYCGYCKSDYDQNGECQCNGHGHAQGSVGTCGYCGSDYFEGPGIDCSCDGFGGDPETGEKACRYCSGTAVGNWCDECNRAQ